LHGVSFDEIATALDMSPSGVWRKRGETHPSKAAVLARKRDGWAIGRADSQSA
jgi:hypothetical protein